MKDKKIDILIVDDNHFYRKGLILALKRIENIGLISEATDGNEFIQIINKTDPDIVLMDIKMPGLDGIKATKQALNQNQFIKIIAITIFNDENYLLDMMGVGAKGFLLKDAVEKELEEAINTVLQGKFYYSERALNNLNLH